MVCQSCKERGMKVRLRTFVLCSAGRNVVKATTFMENSSSSRFTAKESPRNDCTSAGLIQPGCFFPIVLIWSYVLSERRISHDTTFCAYARYAINPRQQRKI